MKKSELMVKRAFNTEALAVYIVDDGTWDGTQEDASRFRQAEFGHEELAEDPTLPYRLAAMKAERRG